MLIGDLACLAVLALQAVFAMDLLRREIPRAIQRQEITALVKGVRFQCLSTLQLSKDIVEHGSN